MHSVIKDALSYWEGLCGNRNTPLRSDFDPIDIPQLLPDLVFFEVIDGGLDFKFRVVGGNARSVFFENYTGKLISSLPHVEADGPLMRALRLAVQSGKPVRDPAEYVGPQKDFRKQDEIILPLANEAGDITHLLVWIVLLAKKAR